MRFPEPEDDIFVMRWWLDGQILIAMLARLRRVAGLATRVPTARPAVGPALRAFDDALPSLRSLRDVAEHIDEYALDQGRRSNISRQSLEVGGWDGKRLSWLGVRLDVDHAEGAAQRLVAAIRAARDRCTEVEHATQVVRASERDVRSRLLKD